jgi:hypothetical protein
MEALQADANTASSASAVVDDIPAAVADTADIPAAVADADAHAHASTSTTVGQACVGVCHAVATMPLIRHHALQEVDIPSPELIQIDSCSLVMLLFVRRRRRRERRRARRR